MAQNHDYDAESTSGLPALLHLPPELLRKIASFVDSAGLVVAIYGAKEPGEAGEKSRAAVRAGVDDAERARFGGWPGLTIAEAQACVAHVPGVTERALASPQAAGDFLGRRIGDYAVRRQLRAQNVFVANMLAYGAKPDVVVELYGSVGWTPLHFAAAGAWPNHYRAIEALLAADAD